MSPAPGAPGREDAARQLFRDLHERLGTHCRDPATLSVFEISAERARPGGLEFHLLGPGARLDFVDTLEGTIAVHAGDGSRRELVEILAVQPEGTAFRPIRKPMRARQRTGYSFTSVADLGRRYSAWARSGPPREDAYGS